jgi:hypothetical protein
MLQCCQGHAFHTYVHLQQVHHCVSKLGRDVAPRTEVSATWVICTANAPLVVEVTGTLGLAVACAVKRVNLATGLLEH